MRTKHAKPRDIAHVTVDGRPKCSIGSMITRHELDDALRGTKAGYQCDGTRRQCQKVADVLAAAFPARTFAVVPGPCPVYTAQQDADQAEQDRDREQEIRAATQEARAPYTKPEISNHAHLRHRHDFTDRRHDARGGRRHRRHRARRRPVRYVYALRC